ncbi:tetratricopeptide repeat protein [Bacillus sp. OxB-1]|uniref:tetratricopeptide repeat protein n=1 Tax=Bacillus sp. (strain OxB-1) TaxID=98228 RepID=UPI0005971288|nr:tetratricopeptide repeat protein [Bacillus sp. OxB-1]
MRRKYGRLRKKGNMIVFPGTYEMLVEKGYTYVERAQFDKAVEAFDQAVIYEPDSVEFLGPYAVALYETKDFTRAKEMASRLLHSGTADYVDAMELYLTISMQLQEYEEVEMTIGALLEEGAVPHELMNKFQYLRELNERLMKRYPPERETDPAPVPYSVEEFLHWGRDAQQMALASMEGTEVTHLIPFLVEVVEREEMAPLVITFALILLHQADYEGEVTVRKYGSARTIIPAQLDLPTEDEQTVEILRQIEMMLMKDPSQLELAKGLIKKYSFLAFPFGWGDFPPEEIASAYKSYLDWLFDGVPLADNELVTRIRAVDEDSEF